MINTIYDVCIIGAGLAGISTALRITEQNPKIKIKLFDLGRPPGKRRRQLEGWMGAFPAGDGKLYLNDINKVGQKTNLKLTKTLYKWISEYLNQVDDLVVIKDPLPFKRFQNKILKEGFEIEGNDYIQWIPETIHQFSRLLSNCLKSNSNFELSCDNEVLSIEKNQDIFKLITQQGEILSNKIIIAVGRSGWRWLHDVYKNLNIPSQNNFAKFGICLEIGSGQAEDLNQSHCSLKKDNLEVGPFSWNGSIIPEDHIDFVISAFRSNEARWDSQKVSFNVVREIFFPNQGVQQLERLGKLAFVLFNDRVSKERLKVLMKDQSQLSLLPEFSWLKEDIKLLNQLIPDLIAKANLYVPTIQPMAPQIKLTDRLESQDMPGLFVAGESSGLVGLLAAALSGAVVGERICE